MRLIDSDGKMLGVTSVEKALNIAKKQGYDLVEISPNSVPVVCKIMDFGKYKYHLKKKEQEAKKKQKVIEIKEVKLRPNIATGDFDIKLNNTRRFISNKNKVKITLFYKGREIMHEKIGMNIIENFRAKVQQFAKIENDIKKEGKRVFFTASPK